MLYVIGFGCIFMTGYWIYWYGMGIEYPWSLEGIQIGKRAKLPMYIRMIIRIFSIMLILMLVHCILDSPLYTPRCITPSRDNIACKLPAERPWGKKISCLFLPLLPAIIKRRNTSAGH